MEPPVLGTPPAPASDERGAPPPTVGPASLPAAAGTEARTTATAWAATALGVLLLIGGLAGADRALYVHVCQRINTADTAQRDINDLYQRTKPLWMLARFAVQFVGVATLAWLAVTQAARRRAVLAAAITVAFVAGGANVLQMAIGRARPNAAASQWTFFAPFSGLTHAHPDGFPSGEVAAAFAFAAVLVRVASPSGGRALPTRGSALPLYGLATLTALARWLPGMHYLSDVAAGALLGAWLGDATCGWLQRRLFVQPRTN